MLYYICYIKLYMYDVSCYVYIYYVIISCPQPPINIYINIYIVQEKKTQNDRENNKNIEQHRKNTKEDSAKIISHVIYFIYILYKLYVVICFIL